MTSVPLRRRLSIALFLVLPLALSAQSLMGIGGAKGTKDKPLELSLELVPTPGAKDFEVRVRFVHGEGYHTYAPSDSPFGAPIEVVPQPVEGVQFEPVQYPPGIKKSYPLLGGDLLLYEGELEVPVRGTLVGDAPPEKLRIQVGYSVCTDQVCLLPQEKILELAWNSAASPEEEEASASSAKAPTASKTEPTSEDPTPESDSAPSSPSSSSSFEEALQGGLLKALFLCYLIGLGASLSPCVYPMIPVTIAIFGGDQAQPSRVRRLGRALVYVLGIVFSYALAGVLAARFGQDLGAAMTHPGVIGLVSLTLAAMGLSLFGLFELQLPPSIQDRLPQGGEGGWIQVFFTGAVLGLVAAPCVGPFAASILLWVAQTQNMVLGFFSLASFGLGMGTLFLALALGASGLPRSGMWMVQLKKCFGYLLIGAALFYASPLLGEEAGGLAWGVFWVVGAVFAGAFEPSASDAARLARGIGLSMFLVGAHCILATVNARIPLFVSVEGGIAAAPEAEAEWIEDWEEAKSLALAEGKPLFVDFYADYCAPCKQMEAEVFPDPEVQQLLGEFIAVRLDVTDPKSEAAQFKTKTLQSFGMPYLAIFDQEGNLVPELSHQGYLDTAAFRALLENALADFEDLD